MNITQESTGELTATVKIGLAREDYENQVNKVLKDYQRKASMPGFRPGKVPMGIVKKMYGKAVLADEVNKVISENLHNYLEENKIKTLGHPLPNEDKQEMIDFDTQEQFDFFFDIALQPEVAIELSDKIKMDYFKIRVDEESINKYVEDLRKKNGQPLNPDKSQEGDILRGHIVELDSNGQAREDGIKNETSIGVDFIKNKTIKKKFIGIGKDDKVIFNPMKATESAAEAGSMLGIESGEAEKIKGDFEFTVDTVTRFEPAEMGESFYASVFPGETFKDEKAFRERLGKELEVSFARESDRLFMRRTADKLIDDSKINLPDDFMKRWLMESGESQVSAEDVENHYEEYARALKWQLIESKIVADHKIQVTPDDVREQIMSYFKTPGDVDEEMQKRLNEIANNIMQNEEEVKRIYDQLLDTRMRDLLKTTLKLKDKEVSYDDFIKLASETK
ncbi:MAG TPA: trigger factor [Bacteroidales bacterium]|nr:trigger factor [Bacteroidales bacterium]